MNLAETLLENLEDSYLVHPELEPHIVIDTERNIHVPDKLKRIAVERDHNIETVTFDCPRYWDGQDLSEMYIYVNYIRADKVKGTYLCKNVTVDSADKNIIHFTWTLEEFATLKQGKLRFLVCAKKTGTDGILENHWNSELCDVMRVSEGLECEDVVYDMNPAIITDLLTRMDHILKANDPLVLDTSMTESGLAADAAAVGNWLRRVDTSLEYLTTYVTPQMYGNDFAVAIDSMFGGDVLYIPDGLYELPSSVTITKNIKIVSNGGIIRQNGFIVKNADVSFDGLNFVDILQNAIETDDAVVKVSNCNFYNIGVDPDLDETHSGCGVYACNDSEITVIDSTFCRCHGHGAIFSRDGGFVDIRNNIITDNYYRGIELYGEGVVNGMIVNNHISECGAPNETGSGIGCNGVYSTNGDQVVIDNNVILNSRENGIEGVFYKISNNYIDGTGVESDIKPTPSTEGMYLNGGAYITNNIIINTDAAGIKRYSASAITEDTVISNNVIQKSGIGVSIDYNSDVRIDNLMLIDNIVDGGVNVRNASESVIYKGDISKLSGKANLKLNNSVMYYVHYFDEIEPFLYSNCDPTINTDSTTSEKYISVPYKQYAKLRYKLPRINGAARMQLTFVARGHFHIDLMNGAAYLDQVGSVNTSEFEEITMTLGFDANYKNKYEFNVIPYSSGRGCDIKYMKIELYN